MTRIRRRLPLARIGGSLVALCLAAASTVALAQHSSTAAFTGQTEDTGNTVTSAASFCAVPGGTTLTVVNDTYVDEANPAVARGGSTTLRVSSGTGVVAHTYLRFDLPTLQNHCAITSASLRLWALSTQGSGAIDVHRASTSWSSATNTWNTVPRPAPAGTGIGTRAGTTGWHEWSVTVLVTEQYAGPNYGFLVKDRAEDPSPAQATVYESLDSVTVANRPQLVLTWG